MVLIDEQSNDGLLKVTLTANLVVQSATVDSQLLEDKDQWGNFMNKATQKGYKSK